MLYKSWNGKSENELLGYYIFHKSKGGIPLLGLPFTNSINIGSYLGKVCKVNNANRIYYTDINNEMKYVSLVGIGIVCSTEEMAKKVNDLRKKYHLELKSFMSNMGSNIEKSLIDINR